MSEELSLEEAINRVREELYFSKVNREDFESCPVFCDLLRKAPYELLCRLQYFLGVIALETDDHNEASGFLHALITLGAGFSEKPSSNSYATRSVIPITDVSKFADWVTSIPEAEIDSALKTANDLLLKHRIRIPSNDYQARLTHKQIRALKYYGLEPLKNLLIFGNSATENFDSSFNIDEQIHPLSWAVFSERPSADQQKLIAHWWGNDADVPNDLVVALDWQRRGLINISRGKGYHDAIAEYILFNCAPGDSSYGEPVRRNHGVVAILTDPFIAQDLYDGLSKKEVRRWLISHDSQHRADYLASLFSAGVLDRGEIINFIELGALEERNKNYKLAYQQLLSYLA